MVANRKQIIKNIANIIRRHPNKMDQLERVKSITVCMTSDDHINIVCEMYSENITRYLITGTRANMTITYKSDTDQIVRKPRGLEPWMVAKTDCYVCEIMEIVNK